MKGWTSPRPKSDGATGKVWEIADQITRESGRRASRKEVIDRVVAAGGNANTASTQYHHWKIAQGGAAEPTCRTVDPVRLVVGSDGRVVIPVDIRRAMALDEAGSVMAQVVEGELRMRSLKVALTRAQALVRAFDTGAGSPVDELIRERRAEAERE